MSEAKYQLVPTKTFLKELKKVARVTPRMSKRIAETLEDLEKNPYQGRKLEAIPFGKWRIRIGDYRIRYDIEGDQVILYKILHRKEIYRR
jgi:mRNA interferase RelE/StbE